MVPIRVSVCAAAPALAEDGDRLVSVGRGLLPVPDRETLVGESVALLTMERLPVKLPVVVGAKVALKAALPPGAKTRGNERPLALKLPPVTSTCVTFTLPVPGFVRVTALVLLLPTTTLPKLRVVGLASRSVDPAASWDRKKITTQMHIEKKSSGRGPPHRLSPRLRF